MKKLVSTSVIACILAIPLNLAAQDDIEIPDFITTPNFLLTSGIIDSVLQYSDYSSGDSTALRKWEYTQMEEDNHYKSYQYFWNNKSDAWSVREKYEYSCDNCRRYTMQAHYRWRGFHNEWRGCDMEGCGKKEWAYDSTGNLVMSRQSYWCDDWRIFDWKEREYQTDPEGRVMLALEIDLQRDECWESYWGYSRREEYGYDEDGNQTLWADYHWDFELNDWVGDYKLENSYDSNDNQIGHVFYSWTEGERNDWYPIYKEEKEYNENGMMKSISRFQWFGAEGGWIPADYDWGFEKIAWEYDSAGRKIKTICYNGDSDKRTWREIVQIANTYDTFGRPIVETIIYNWGYRYSYVKKITRDYDEYGNISSEISVFWDFNNNTWNWERDYDEGPRRTENSYDLKGNLIMQIEYIWDSTDLWIPYRKYECIYDDSGNQTVEAYYNWDSELKIWYGNKYEKQYDQSGNMVENIGYLIDSTNTCYPESKQIWKFNESGFQTHHSTYQWSSDLNVWIGQDKEEKLYDDAERLIKEAYYRWDSNRNDWMGWHGDYNYDTGKYGPGKVEFEYDDKDNLVMFAQYMWSSGSNSWKGYYDSRKMEWLYDESGILFQEVISEWKSEENDWIRNHKYIKVFNEFGDPSIQHQYIWDTDLSDWILAQRWFYYYKSSLTGKDDIIFSDIILFPNPTSGVINITGLTEPVTIKIYNLQGQQLKSYYKVQNTIDLSDLNKGVYILNLKVGDQRVVRKVVRE